MPVRWVGKGKTSALHALSKLSKLINIKLATTVRIGHFVRNLDLDFANVNMACPYCLFVHTALSKKETSEANQKKEDIDTLT